MKIELKDAWVDGLLDQGRAEGRAQGEAEGRAEMLLHLLSARFKLTGSIRDRVKACTDTTQIGTWFDRAITANSLDEVFARLQSVCSRASQRVRRRPGEQARWPTGRDMRSTDAVMKKSLKVFSRA